MSRNILLVEQSVNIDSKQLKEQAAIKSALVLGSLLSSGKHKVTGNSALAHFDVNHIAIQQKSDELNCL